MKILKKRGLYTNKKYGNIHRLREKVIKFEMDNLQKVSNDVFKELYAQNKETFYKLKKDKESKPSIYVDENNQKFSNNNPDYLESGEVGKSSM